MKNKFTKLTACVCLLTAFLFFAVQAAISQTVLLNPASPFIVPAGVSQIKVECWGGGGAGGGINSTLASGGSGGGGGGYTTSVLNVSPGQSYTIVIGTGGIGASDANGGNGTASSVSGPGGTVTGNFGTGGGRRAGAAGIGGAGTFAGGNSVVASGAGSGGGGGAGNAGAGGAGSNSAAGTAGAGTPNAAPYVGGVGGGIRNGTGGNPGFPGNAPGGGGGGAYNALFNGAKAGGNGGAGQVIITYCQTFSLTSISAVSPICSATATSVVTLNGNFPVGSYTVTYNRSLPAATGLTATMTVSSANTGTFTATGLTGVGTPTITITSIGSVTSPFCTNNINANNVIGITVYQSPSLFTVGGGGTYCTGGPGLPITLSGSELNVNYQLLNGPTPVATLAGTGSGLTFTNITNAGNYTIVGTHTIGGCTTTMTGTVTISLNPLPVLSTFTNSSPLHCIGMASSVLSATGTVSSVGTITADNFNGAAVFAAAGSNSGGGAAFSNRTSPYSAGALTTITNNDGSNFMIATVNVAFSSASTSSTLTSPVVNTSAYSSLTLSFRHSYAKGSEAGVSVQVSTDGGTNWSNISTAGAVTGSNTYTANVGANNNFVATSINLNSFINNPNFRVRFNYNANTVLGTFWWAIDDVTLNGQFIPLFSYAASTGAGVNGLPGGASTPLISNKTITVNPTVTTTYTLTEQDPVTGCSVSSTTTVTVNQNSTLTLNSPAGTDAQTVCMPGSIADITYAIGGGGTGASITAGSLPAGLTAGYSAGVFTISGTPTEFGNFSYTLTTAGPCINVSLSGTLSVNTAPTLSCPPNVTINTDPGLCLATRTYSATATGFPAPTVSYLVNGEFINFPYDFPLGVTNVDVLAEGSCSPDASCSFTVTVEDHEGPSPDISLLPDVTGECSATVTDTPTATDACEGTIFATTADALTYSAQGTYTVTWTYTDSKGNSTNQTQKVIVNDVTPPTITCPSTQNFCSTLANTFTIPVLVATDNCSISSTSYQVTGATSRSGTGNDASGLFNPGISTILWTVVDGNNNSSTCSTTVNVNQIPLVPTVTGIVNVCPYLGTGDQLPYVASAVGATNFTWTIPTNVNVISGLGTSTLTLSFNNAFSTNGNQQLRVRASNACGVSPQAIYYLLTQYPNTPNPINGPTNVCTYINTATTATYSIPPAMSAVAYLWTGPAGTTITHPNAPGINDTIINVTYSSSFAGGQITVYGRDSCGTSGARNLNIPRTSSSLPGLISGPTNVCANILPGGSAAVYTIRAVNGATSYTWLAPAGSTTAHPNGPGINDTVFTVQYAPGFSNGNITVSSTNGCGTSGLRSLALNKLNPATPSVIDVIQLGFCEDAGGRVYSYTLSSMPANAVTVQWTVPTSAGAVLLSGQGTSSITVSYPSTAVVGNVTAQAFNNCASSTIRTTPVKLPACPPPGFTKGNTEELLKKSSQPVPADQNKLEVKISPNPTVSDVALQVLTAGKERIDVRIIDMQGREFKRMTIMPYQTLHIGSDLKAGSYFVEIVQGEKKTTQKLVKF